ncbi:MAG TPA: tetratricopeptide repeat protein, partial [Verrucomicrobiales bacterium]|nr:tetratricopeptide repeat protein [Verrucomicrobiales bacterium]
MADLPQKHSESEHPHNLDALSASEAGGVVDAIDRHRTKILAGIAVSAVVLCGILVTSQLRKQKHIEASEAFTTAATKGEIPALDAVVIEHPGSVPAGNALLAKAELLVDQGKSEDAKKALEQFTSNFQSHPRYAQGLFALANLFHVAGDREKAKAQYDAVIVAQPDGELTPLSLIRLGDLALEGGDKKAADQLYQDSFILHPGNPFFEYAQEKIALLKVGTPKEVTKPEPKPEPAPEKPPVATTPAAPAPAAPKPATTAPAAPKPATSTPAAPKPATTAPAAPKPATTAPAAPKPTATAPAAPKP